MAQSKPSQFTAAPTGNQTVDKVQNSLKQTTEAVRNGPMPRQLVTGLSKNSPGQGVTFKPGQTIDIPHNLGRIPAGFNIAKIITNTNSSSSMPYASPNLQLVPVNGPLGQKIMRLKYVAPTDSDGNPVTTPVRLHLELF
jgi:hypothetical protein